MHCKPEIWGGGQTDVGTGESIAACQKTLLASCKLSCHPGVETVRAPSLPTTERSVVLPAADVGCIGCIDEAVGMIQDQFRSKAEDYLYRYYNPYVAQTEEDIVAKDLFEEEDVFTFEIKVHGNIVAQKQFSGNTFEIK